ncbi:MAG: hypothetical protein WD044_13780 [Dongiaceae bacterium]
MPENKNIDPNALPPSADNLRSMLADEKTTEMKKREIQRAAEQKKLTDFTDDFLKSEVTESEIASVRGLVMSAVKDGKFEALVYTFPSDLCTDSGRAINSGDPDWPKTLLGKAKQFYERFMKFGKPQGFRLKAMIINFPGGMPGDVGFYLNWAPETK